MPTTVDEYCLQHKKPTSSVDMTDDYYDRDDDDYYQDYSASDTDQDIMTSSGEEEVGDQVDSGTA